MSAPRIAIAIGREQIGSQVFAATPEDYVDCVVDAGGAPVLVPPLPTELVPEMVRNLDAIVLTGGGDVAPSRYDATAEPETDGIDEQRDASELALIATASLLQVPILAICRGAQILNVAFGGTLHQHLSSEPISHREAKRRAEPVHRVEFKPDSLFAELSRLTSVEVNSIHHQGIDRVGSSLFAVGFAEDGVVEALQSEDRRILAVQWHPECLRSLPLNQALFFWLVEQAREFALRAHD